MKFYKILLTFLIVLPSISFGRRPPNSGQDSLIVKRGKELSFCEEYYNNGKCASYKQLASWNLLEEKVGGVNKSNNEQNGKIGLIEEKLNKKASKKYVDEVFEDKMKQLIGELARMTTKEEIESLVETIVAKRVNQILESKILKESN